MTRKTIRKSVLILPLLILGTAQLSACAVATAGIAKGDERNFVRSLNDVNSGRAITARLKRAHDYNMSGVDVEVSEGVVLLSGNVPTKEDRIEAARIAWSARNIIQVGNEIMIKDKQAFIRNTKDGLLEKSVRARLAADKYVKGRNFNIETHDGIVYLLGVARDQRELERAARIASLTRGTVEVVSYVRLAELDTASADAQHDRRSLPDFVSDAPMPLQDGTDYAAPMRRAPDGESIPRSAYPENYPGPEQAYGDVVIPNDPNAAPYYVDPGTGEQIPVRFRQSGK